jgi:hypothetical protein
VFPSPKTRILIFKTTNSSSFEPPIPHEIKTARIQSRTNGKSRLTWIILKDVLMNQLHHQMLNGY